MAVIEAFERRSHPRTKAILDGSAKPLTTHEIAERRLGAANAKIGLRITLIVGTMWCAYAFGIIALISLPSALKSGNLTIIIAWVSSNFLQLILLPVIIVGQNIQAAASDKRAESTYEDAEAVLHEALEIQRHLGTQDELLQLLVTRLEELEAAPAPGGGGPVAPAPPLAAPAPPAPS